MASWWPRDDDPDGIHVRLDDVSIPYVAYWSYGEKIPAVEELDPGPLQIGRSLQRLATTLGSRLEDPSATAKPIEPDGPMSWTNVVRLAKATTPADRAAVDGRLLAAAEKAGIKFGDAPDWMFDVATTAQSIPGAVPESHAGCLASYAAWRIDQLSR